MIPVTFWSASDAFWYFYSCDVSAASFEGHISSSRIPAGFSAVMIVCAVEQVLSPILSR